MLERKPKRYRYPLELISIAVWSYHRFNDRYRDVSERLLYRGIDESYETIRQWCIKFGPPFKSVIKKRASRPSDKWHLDEQHLRIRGATYYLWRALDDEGYELDVFVQKRRNKKAAIRFLSRLLNAHQPTRRKEKCLIRFKSPEGAQSVIALMGSIRNIFAVAVGRYTKPAQQRRSQFQSAKEIWGNAASELLCALNSTAAICLFCKKLN